MLKAQFSGLITFINNFITTRRIHLTFGSRINFVREERA